MCQHEMTIQPIGSNLSRELFVEQERKPIRNKDIKRGKISYFKILEVRWKNQARGSIEQGLLRVFYKKMWEVSFLISGYTNDFLNSRYWRDCLNKSYLVRFCSSFPELRQPGLARFLASRPSIRGMQRTTQKKKKKTQAWQLQDTSFKK